MTSDQYIGTVISAEGRQYTIKGILGEGGQGVVLRTEDGFLIKINTSKEKEAYKNRYKWLLNKSHRLPPEVRIAFPIALLDEPNVGYVMKEAKGHVPLNLYIEKSEEIEDFSDWYFNATGGLMKRLQIGFLLAKSLRTLHLNGCAYVDLSPQNVLVARKKNSIAIIDSDNITSGTYKPIIKGTDYYMAPEIAKGQASASSITDTYSYAIILFQMLTSVHPFIGDDMEDEAPDAVVNAVNNGEAVYIDNNDDNVNYSSVFDNTKVFLTDELRELFRRMFVKGKENPELRPTLMEFMNACEHAMANVYYCRHSGCFAQYYPTKNDTCPLCDSRTEKHYILQAVDMLSADKPVVPNETGEKKALKASGGEIGRWIIKPGANIIKADFLDSGIPFDKDIPILLVNASADVSRISVLNCTKIKMFINRQMQGKWEELPVYSNNNKLVEVKALDGVFLYPNKSIITGASIDFSTVENFYGKTVLRKYLIFRLSVEEP